MTTVYKCKIKSKKCSLVCITAMSCHVMNDDTHSRDCSKKLHKIGCLEKEFITFDIQNYQDYLFYVYLIMDMDIMLCVVTTVLFTEWPKYTVCTCLFNIINDSILF